MNKVYKLRTLNDIFEQVPLDRMESCFDELKTGMITSRMTVDLMKATGEAGGHNIKLFSPEVWTWTDDDKGEIDINLGVDDEVIGSVKVRKEQT